jgi:tetratricopeptide (TPR) repeat protein
MDNYGYALKYGKLALELGKEDVNDELYYVLALAYHRNGVLDSAIMHYETAIERLSKMRANELRIQHNVDQCKYAQSLLASEATFERKRIEGDINSGYNDYSIVLSSEDTVMYFVSRRSDTKGGRMNPDDQLYFEDTYRVVYNEEDQRWSDASNKLGKLNSEGFDALNWISPDGHWAVMTLNNTMTDEKKTTRVSDICIVKKNKQGYWNSPKPIDNKTINTSYFDGAASLTADGNMMFFVSDRKGDKKSTDIYMVERNGKKWGMAKPLPDNINTIGRETTPFITPDGKYLFFSSDGIAEGMGGTDIYVSKNLGDSWSDPVNLGRDINTVNNDTHFVFDSKHKKGYVAGLEIIGQKASIDLYEIDMSDFEFPE